MAKFLVLFGISLIIAVSHQEMFTAIVDLERLLDTEKKIVQSLEEYLKAEESRLERLTQMKNNYVKIHSLANTDVHSYLANPVNAFLLVKRLTTDWKNVETLMVHGPTEIGQNILSNLSSAHDSFPSVEDLNGAAAALLRLQDTYKLDTSSLARGEIPLREPNESSTMSIELTAGDCFELGKHSYNNNDHYHTVLWMQEALDRVFAEDAKTADVSDILEYLAFSTYSEGNIRHALKLTNDLLELLPNHERALGNKVYYDDMIKKQTESKLRGDEGNKVPIDETVIEKLKTSPREETERETYEALCRGEKRISARTESTLFCFYYKVRNPFMKLMRIKVEEAFKKPHILVFYDVMSNSEIDVVKTLASPKLKRATVQNYKTGDLETAQYRISKSAWLRNEEHEIVNRISQRVEDIIDLEVDTAEELQVVNYGIGGHYEPHYDFARREEKNAFKSLGTGNRIATWLNYMTDVEAGGATVFPMLGVTIWPKKGSAAFWYNLHRSGEGDLLTRHAACPVLVGSKWVSNKWFHESGQEFRRTCGLKVNE